MSGYLYIQTRYTLKSAPVSSTCSHQVASFVGAEHWSHQMFYPVVQSDREHTALKFGGKAYTE